MLIYYTLVHFSYSLNIHVKYARMSSKINILQYIVTYETYGDTLNVLTSLLKPVKSLKTMMDLLGISSFVLDFWLSQT